MGGSVMKRKIVWLVVSCMMVAVLVLASCSSAEEDEVIPPPLAEEEVAPPAVEEPEYGGVFYYCLPIGPQYFDQSVGSLHLAITTMLTNDGLVQGDWAKGLAGTGETKWYHYMLPPQKLLTGGVAESWEFLDNQTLIFHIRPGIHFHDKPPVNGRELNARDVVDTIEHIWANPSSGYSDYPYESISTPDEWTLEVKLSLENLSSFWGASALGTMIYPSEMIGENGDLSDWTDSIGTGPFILVDYVEHSAVTFVRNHNYWMKDPLHTENQLPYLDGLKWLVITDSPTWMSAIRTGRIDHLGPWTAFGWEDGKDLIQTNPELKWLRWTTGATALFWRVDKPGLPFQNKKVRQALAMAIDNQEISDVLYGGNAEILAWPWLPTPEHSDAYIPLGELPVSTRELFEYHPDKAKRLLAEAGYPDGFQTEIVCYSDHVDQLSLVKAHWAEIGVDLEINVMDPGTFYSTVTEHEHKQMVSADISMIAPMYTYLDGPYNLSGVDDPHLNDVWPAVKTSFPDEAKERNLLKDATEYVLDQVYLLQLPAPYYYTFWQPWVKGYHGEFAVGYVNCAHNFQKYIWLDLDLKEKLTGRR